LVIKLIVKNNRHGKNRGKDKKIFYKRNTFNVKKNNFLDNEKVEKKSFIEKAEQKQSRNNQIMP